MANLKTVEKNIIDQTTKKIVSLASKIRRNCFFMHSSVISVDFPNAILIGRNAFSQCTSLTSVSCSNATLIENGAFWNCSNLTSVTFPNVTSIEGDAFSGCSSLTSVTFPNVTSIEGYTFSNCSNLTSVTFPNVTSIESYAFNQCSSLTNISFLKLTTLNIVSFDLCSSLKLYIGRNGYLPLINSVSSSWGSCKEIHIEGTVVTSIPTIKISDTSIKFYFEYMDGDTYNFTPALTKGSSKLPVNYSNLYTDNTSIKDTLLSFVDEYTMVTVKHLDGSDW